MTKEELRKSLDFVNEERERLQRELERKDNIINGIKKEINEQLEKYEKSYIEKEDYKSRIEKAVEYIKKDTRWFDSEYAKVYGELCSCIGVNDNRLEVLVNPSNLLNILNGRSDE